MTTHRALPVRRRGTYEQSVLVLGAAQLGSAYGIANTTGMPDDRSIRRLLRVAAELGVTHVDTAREYGESERRIGGVLSSSDGPQLRVITKVAPLMTGSADPAAARSVVEASVRASLAELGARRPLTVLLHRAADAAAGGGGGWERLREYLEAGVADRIGVSIQSPDELRRVIDLPDLGYLQLPCNVLDRRWLSDEISTALSARHDLVVTVRSVYLQGLLAAGRGVAWPHLPDQRRDQIVAALDAMAAALGRAGRIDLCVAYVLSLPWVTSVVVGAEAEVQLRRNAALASRPPLSSTERERLLAAIPEVPADLVDPSRWRG